MAKPPSRKYDVGPPKKYSPANRTKAQRDHFFIDGKLYKKIHQDKPNDLLTVWDFEKEERKTFMLSDAKRKMKNAYDTKEVAAMLNRTPRAIQGFLMRGQIKEPIRIYNQGRNAYGHPFNKMKWSDQDIIAVHEYMLYIGGGRPRKDGTMTPAARLPTRTELLAMLNAQPTFYMQTASGEMVPVWKAYNEV